MLFTKIVLLIAPSLLTAVGSAVLIAWARKRQLLDQPGKRRSHVHPVPTGGGLVFMISWLTVLVLTAWLIALNMGLWWFAWLAALALSCLGWLDDLYNLPVLPRLLVQAAMSLVLVWLFWNSETAAEMSLWARLLTAVFIGWFVVWYINAFNFMDGIDGLALQQALFTLGFFSWLGWSADLPSLFWPATLLLVSLLGFAPRNISPASLFMGDAGSLPLGFLSLAFALLAWSEGLLRWPAALMLLTAFNLDAFLTLVKRWFSNKRCYTPHREHLYQWLVRTGWSHMRVSLVYVLVNTVLVLPFTLWLNSLEEAQGTIVLLLVSASLAIAWWWSRQYLLMNKRKA